MSAGNICEEQSQYQGALRKRREECVSTAYKHMYLMAVKRSHDELRPLPCYIILFRCCHTESLSTLAATANIALDEEASPLTRRACGFKAASTGKKKRPADEGKFQHSRTFALFSDQLWLVFIGIYCE